MRIDRSVSADRRPARSHGEKTCFYHLLVSKGGAKSIRMMFFAGARLDLAKTDAPQFYGTFVPFRLWRLGKVNFALACWPSLASKMSPFFYARFSSAACLLRTKMRSLWCAERNLDYFKRRMLTLRCTPLSMTNSKRSDSRAPLRYARNDIFSFVILRRKP